MAQGDSIGMMEGAFFVSRSEILSWLNDLLQLNIQKIEQLCSGAVYIHVFDAIYPGTVPMHKVNWMAKYEHEFVNNYKILQQIFSKNMVQRHIEVEKLIKGKYQDNLEFAQWLKRYFDLNFRGGDYDALERRRNAKTPWDQGGGRKAAAPSEPKPRATGKTPGQPARRPKSRENAPPQATKSQSSAADQARIKELEDTLAELRLTADTLVKERDFYFGKLRSIELLCEKYEGQENSTIKEVSTILYATDDQQVVVNDDGTVSLETI